MSHTAIELDELYLDYVNNFLTVEKFAEYYGVSVELANLIIKEGRAKHELLSGQAVYVNNKGKVVKA